MSSELTFTENDGTVTINLPVRFSFEAHSAFVASYDSNEPNTNYIIDFKKTKYIDSSALGMLLLLRDKKSGSQANIKFVNYIDDVGKILQTANFQRLFTME